MVNKAVVISEELVGITDAQLQRRLKDEFGFSCGPITGTTKEIYVKKLQEFINTSSKTGGGGKTTTAKSTTNTSVAKTTTPTATPKTRRKTIATPAIDTDIETDSPKPTSKYCFTSFF